MNSELRSFHLRMFHGDEEPYRLDDTAQIHLVRNIHSIPHIFTPSLNLVVTAALAEQLSKATTAELRPVIWRHVYNLPWKVGEMRLPRGLKSDRYPNVQEFALRVPATASDPGPYAEFIPKAADTSDGEPVRLLYDFQYRQQARINRSQLAHEGALRFEGITLFRDDVFAAIDSHLDRTFFLVDQQ